MIQKKCSCLVVFLIFIIVFWLNVLYNKPSVSNIMVVDEVKLFSQNIFEVNKMSSNGETSVKKHLENDEGEVISYFTTSDNEINNENKVTGLDGAIDLFSGYFYHPVACKRISDVVKKNSSSIAVSAIQRKQTRLGDQLSNFATGYAIWRDFGILNYMDPKQLSIIGKAFKLPTYKETDNNACYYTWLKGCLKFMDTIKWTMFNQSLLDISAPRQHLNKLKRGHYIKLPTYVADFKGFVPYLNDLKRNIFKFYNKFSNISTKLYQKMIQRAKGDLDEKQVQNFTTVSIHIRLTDFGNHLKKHWNITYAKEDYFSRAMKYFTDRYKNVLFYLVSDDYDTAKKYVLTEKNRHYNIVLPYTGVRKVPEVDLALLSLSDHSIITFGKFGLWGSLLGKEDKLTICPKDYMKTDIGKEVHKAKLPNWIFL